VPNRIRGRAATVSLGVRRLRVAVVAPIMVRHDAISLSARDAVRSLAADPRFEVQHLGCVCDFPDIVHRPCGDIADLLLDPFYQTADAAIFHFGIHHSLFDALLAGGPPVRVVRFHNVTPMRFVAPAEMPVIERSLRQIDILRNADEIWADSPTNERDLLDRGFDPSRIRVIPLVVEDPDVATLAGKPAAPVRALYIGRIAASKGLHDLILAAARTGLPHGVLQVTIAGNTAWSDPGYLRKLHDLIASHELARVVHFVGTVDDSDRERLLHDAHILVVPSYHEGFCRPVAEGLRAGCVPLVYDAYNLPRIAGGLGRVTPTGDIGRLAVALDSLTRELPPALERPDEPLLSLDRGRTSITEFSSLALRHVAGFAFDAVSAEIRERLLRLAVNGKCQAG